LYGAEIGTSRKVVNKYFERSEMWRWSSVGPILCKMNMFYIVTEKMGILRTVKRVKVNWIGNILRRNCLLKHVIGEKIEGKMRWERRCKQLLDDFNKSGR
jgi:hypothetical protein